MTVVDASVIIAYLDPLDVLHIRAVDLLSKAVGELVVHPLTAADILVHPTRAGVHEAVWHDLAAIGLVVDNSPIIPQQLAHLRVSTGCKMPDCCVLAAALDRQAGLMTFDHKLATAAHELGVLVAGL